MIQRETALGPLYKRMAQETGWTYDQIDDLTRGEFFDYFSHPDAPSLQRGRLGL